jgi:hypothetical protein
MPPSTTASITAKTSVVPSTKRSRKRKPITSSASSAPPARAAAARMRLRPGIALAAEMDAENSPWTVMREAMIAAVRLHAAATKPLAFNPSEGIRTSSAARVPATAPSVLMP